MRSVFVVFVLLLLAGPATAAFCEVREFGPAEFRFSLDVPAGWQIQERPGGVSVHTADGSAYAAVFAHRTGGRSQQQIIKALSSEPETVSCSRGPGGIWLLVSRKNGVRLSSTLQFFGPVLLVTSYAGPGGKVAPVLKTLKLKSRSGE